MGGCASRPKDLDLQAGEAPTEVPSTPNQADAETVAQESNKEGGETSSEKTEDPLVGLSEPKEEEKKEEPTPTVNPAEEAKPEEKVEDAAETKEPAEQPNKAPILEDKSDASLVTL